MIKIAIDKGPNVKGDSIRGIGMHMRLLVDELKKNKEILIEEVDCWDQNISKKYNVVHFPSFHPNFLSLPFFKNTKIVLTIHDLIRLIYPSKYPSGIKGKIYFLINWILISRVDQIITISETSKKDIIRFLNIPDEKISVIYLAAGESYRIINDRKLLSIIKNKYDLPSEFILYTGDVNYNKNLITLCEAAVRLKKYLVIVGKQAADDNVDFSNIENKPFREFLNKYGDNKFIKRLGFVSNDDLSVIYNLATVYCQPSFYEGFGLPILEAFASGCPVVASRTQVFTEIADGAFLPFDPYSVDSLVDSLNKVLVNKLLQKKLISKGFECISNFSWKKTANETLQVYQRVAGMK